MLLTWPLYTKYGDGTHAPFWRESHKHGTTVPPGFLPIQDRVTEPHTDLGMCVFAKQAILKGKALPNVIKTPKQQSVGCKVGRGPASSNSASMDGRRLSMTSKGKKLLPQP